MGVEDPRRFQGVLSTEGQGGFQKSFRGVSGRSQ